MKAANMATPAPVEKKPNPVIEQLKKIRESKTLALNSTPMLRESITDLAGNEIPLRLRYYQAQGIFHLLLVKRMVLGDGTGLGKTVQVLGFLAYVWEKEVEAKTIVVCPKSAIRQWGAEIKRFTKNIHFFVATGTPVQRKAAWEAWAALPTGPGLPKAVIITNYHGLVRDWGEGVVVKKGSEGAPAPGLVDRLTAKQPKLITVFDECTAFKNPATKTWQIARFLSDRSNRCYGLTATLLKNNLMEGFGIYKVIKPDVFTTKNRFMNDFCVVELQKLATGARIPIVVGYKNLVQFRTTIGPYFYGRAKHEVSSELPNLTTKEIICELTPAEDRKYGEAASGLIELGDGELKDFQDTKALTSLIYCQEVVDSLHLLKFKEGDVISSMMKADIDVKDLGAKEQALLDLLQDEFDGEKVIIYTRFERLVGRLQAILTKNGIKSVRITGKESDKVRAANQDKFQNLNSDIRVIFITDAGSEAINLQAAIGMIFYDSPWSWGNYVQLLGRMIRIGSPHPAVLAVHLVAERPNREGKKRDTIDKAVLRTLRKKKGLIDQVIGEAARGALTFERGESGIRDLIEEIRDQAV